MKQTRPAIQPTELPRVLLLGNGMLRLSGGMDWSKLLEDVSTNIIPRSALDRLPLSMQPEALCGKDAENVQRQAASRLCTNTSHPLLKELLKVPFDAIITTNYTYDVEEALTGKKWNERNRAKTRCFLHGSCHVRHNTCLCDVICTEDGRQIPIFHPHGDYLRKHSLVLSYYSYAASIHHLIEYNKTRGNSYLECQESNKPLEVWSWLDYFLLGEVHAVGFGFDLSEFDIWWAIERKAREKANHGKIHAWMIRENDEPVPQQPLFDALNVETRGVMVHAKEYVLAYNDIIKQISARLKDWRR